jgi:hypothetical protein
MMDNVDGILDERGKRYGEFSDNARTAQALKKTMRESAGWERLSDAQKEGFDMVQHKIARVLNGDPTYLDNIVDIVGYSTLVLNEMEKADANIQVGK